MKPKTKAFVDELLKNPKLSQTEAYMRTHKTTNARSAGVSASKLLAKPNILIYMEEHVDMARNKVVQLMNTASREDIQFRSAQDVLDRVYGKPKQAVELQSKVLKINIDLTSAIEED